jgi:hypothetical protein
MIKGRIFQAQSEPNLARTKPMFVFVPSYLFKDNQFQIKEYSLRGWDSINCGANKNAVGSHLFPDLSKPITKKFAMENKSLEHELNDFTSNLSKLMHKHISRIKEFKRPGKTRTEPSIDTEPTH